MDLPCYQHAWVYPITSRRQKIYPGIRRRLWYIVRIGFVQERITWTVIGEERIGGRGRLTAGRRFHLTDV